MRKPFSTESPSLTASSLMRPGTFPETITRRASICPCRYSCWGRIAKCLSETKPAPSKPRITRSVITAGIFFILLLQLVRNLRDFTARRKESRESHHRFIFCLEHRDFKPRIGKLRVYDIEARRHARVERLRLVVQGFLCKFLRLFETFDAALRMSHFAPAVFDEKRDILRRLVFHAFHFALRRLCARDGTRGFTAVEKIPFDVHAHRPFRL